MMSIFATGQRWAQNMARMAYEQMGIGLAAFLLVLAGALVSSDASAAVGLLYFRATAQIDGPILLEWKTETEQDVSAFRLYRAESEGVEPTYLEGSQQAAQGSSLSGYLYFYSDRNVTPGVTYYYTLAEVVAGFPSMLPGPASATALVPATPTSTPTITPSATLTLTPSRTASRTVRSYAALPEPATDRPTATRRFTVTPVPPDTPRPAAPTRPPAQLAQPAAAQRPAPTVGPGRVTTPTGRAVALLPSATATLGMPPAPVPSETPTPEPVASPVLPPTLTLEPTPTSTSQKIARLIIDTPQVEPRPL